VNARRAVAFVVSGRTLARWPDASTLDASAVDAQPGRFRSGHDVWVVQTYLLLRESLRALGHEVSLTSDFPPAAVCVAHWDSLDRFLSGAHGCRVIGVRADRPPLHGAEVVVTQNDLEPDDGRRRFIPLWPQPGLRPRDPDRGVRVETMAYFGRASLLPPWVRGSGLRRQLDALGVTLRICEEAWHDYRDVDLVLSLRAESTLMLDFKPATKLYNAWLAGTPALLGDEPAYSSLRESDLDYCAVATSADVVAAVRRLKQDEPRYRAMVANGALRGRAFTRAATAARWMNLIAEVSAAPARPRSLIRHIGAMALQKLQAKRFRRAHARGQARALQESMRGEGAAPTGRAQGTN
jgi:hypothetical protein